MAKVDLLLAFILTWSVVSTILLIWHSSQHTGDTTLAGPQIIGRRGKEQTGGRGRNEPTPKWPFYDLGAGELEEWRRRRVSEEAGIVKSLGAKGTTELRLGADAAGPVLDFAIVGFAKCGTTAVMRTLAAVAAMPTEKDVCTPVRQTVFYSYNNWAEEYGRGAHTYWEARPLKGSKCPQVMEKAYLKEFAALPRTNLIVGIRNPVLWFQSFVNMMWFQDLTRPRGTIEDFVARDRKLLAGSEDNQRCINHRVCVARARFHLSLARLGKTMMGPAETDLLRSELYQAKRRRNDTSTELKGQFVNGRDTRGIPNNVFLFESNQGREEYFYKDLATFVGVERERLPPLTNTTFQTGSGVNRPEKKEWMQVRDIVSFDICLPQFDYVRKELLPIAYTLKEWLLGYLIPAARHRHDLFIPNIDAFADLIEGYGRDPCSNRLVRNKKDGEYYLANEEGGATTTPLQQDLRPRQSKSTTPEEKKEKKTKKEKRERKKKKPTDLEEKKKKEKEKSTKLEEKKEKETKKEERTRRKKSTNLDEKKDTVIRKDEVKKRRDERKEEEKEATEKERKKAETKKGREERKKEKEKEEKETKEKKTENETKKEKERRKEERNKEKEIKKDEGKKRRDDTKKKEETEKEKEINKKEGKKRRDEREKKEKKDEIEVKKKQGNKR